MLRSCLWIAPFLIALPASARADDSPTFWRENPLAASTMPSVSATPVPVSRAQMFTAVSGQITFVGALKSWRETMRGAGPSSRRDLWKNSLSQGQVALSLGNVNVPGIAGFGGAAGTSLSWQSKSGASFDAGTTARPVQLDEIMQRFDKETSDDKNSLPALDRTSVTWLRAKPFSSKSGEVEAVLLRAARDGKAGEGEDWTSGDFGSVNARLALPGKWNMRGSWTSADLEVGDSASSWNTAATGPLQHPWGIANIAFNWRETQPGYATFSGQNVGGDRGGDAQVTQQIQLPLLTGIVTANASTQERPSLDGVTSGTEMSRAVSGANADLKMQLLPGIALTAKGNVSDTQIDRATTPPAENAASIETGHENLTGTGGDVGLQLKVSKALSLEAGAGVTQATQVVATGAPLSNLENRATISIRHRTGGGSWAASLQTRDRATIADNSATDTPADTTTSSPATPWSRVAGVGVEGERRLFGSFRLSAKVNWMIDRAAQDGDDQGVARLASAQLSLCKAARIDLRYRDGAALPATLGGDPLGSLFASSSFVTGNREIATRLNFGSAANGNGIGLAVEWARQGATASPNDTWKVGLTYK